jgi:glycosyltransferase involved in cell wall biosynthesis
VYKNVKKAGLRKMSKQLKILCAGGSGDVIGTFQHWQHHEDDPSQVAITFSSQLFDLCEVFNAEAYIVGTYGQKQIFKEGFLTIENRPIFWENKSVVFYFIGQIYHEVTFLLKALTFKPDIVIGSNTDCFFVLSLLPYLGIAVIPSLHCVFWAKHKPISKYQRVLAKLNRRFFSQDCLAILSTSEDINQQVQEITHHQARPVVNFLTTYRRNEFADVAPVNPDRATFHVLFAGRIEVDKGVFDLFAIARRFQREGRTNIVFHLCGRGSALAELQQQVQAAGLQATFILHGYCNKPEMRQMFSLCHVVIVPTRTDFVEGLNQVVIEGVLANRPVITSSTCPALNYVQQAVVEVPPDDVQAYGDAILKLQQDAAFYEEKCRSCEGVQEQFYNPANSWGAALHRILRQFERVPPVIGEAPRKALAEDRDLQEAGRFVELAEDSQDAIAVVGVSRPASGEHLDGAGTPADD